MPKPYQKADAYFVGVVKQVVFTDKGGNDLVKMVVEIPVQDWVDGPGLVPLRGQLCSLRVETIRLEQVQDIDIRVGERPRPQ